MSIPYGISSWGISSQLIKEEFNWTEKNWSFHSNYHYIYAPIDSISGNADVLFKRKQIMK